MRDAIQFIVGSVVMMVSGLLTVFNAYDGLYYGLHTWFLILICGLTFLGALVRIIRIQLPREVTHG
jgi:hypothetical protein